MVRRLGVSFNLNMGFNLNEYQMYQRLFLLLQELFATGYFQWLVILIEMFLSQNYTVLISMVSWSIDVLLFLSFL